MRLLWGLSALALGLALLPVTGAGAATSFEQLRRNSSLWPDDDLPTLMDKPVVQAEAPEIREPPDAYFWKILDQILAETGEEDGNAVASRLTMKMEDALGIYGEN